MSENTDKLDAEFSAKADEVSELKGILESAAWERVQKILLEQIRERTGGIVLQPLESADAVYKQEFAKGEISGLHIALAIPQTMLESAKLDLDRLKSEIKENSDVQAAQASDGLGRVDGGVFGGDIKHPE